MASLGQLRCFITVLDLGSVTAAADELGYAQPSVSAQVRQLERSLGVTLFRRVGRGIVPTEEARALRPHAERALLAIDEARRAVADVSELMAGTVRFGVFSTARLYLGAGLIGDILERHPGVRVELIGQHTSEVVEELRRGYVEAACVVLPIEDSGLVVEPVFNDELVLVTSDPERRTQKTISPSVLGDIPLALSEASWGTEDNTRRQLAAAVQATGKTLQVRIDVEDVETALDVAARGLADTVVTRGVVHLLRDRLPPGLHCVSLRPALHETFAIVHRDQAPLSRGAKTVAALVVDRLRSIERAVQDDDSSE